MPLKRSQDSPFLRRATSEENLDPFSPQRLQTGVWLSGDDLPNNGQMTIATQHNRSRSYTQADWNEIRPLFNYLYINCKYSLFEAMMTISECRKFHATEAMYKKYIAIWGIKKNYGQSDKLRYRQMAAFYHRQGKPLPQIDYDGRPIDWNRVWQGSSTAGRIRTQSPTHSQNDLIQTLESNVADTSHDTHFTNTEHTPQSATVFPEPPFTIPPSPKPPVEFNILATLVWSIHRHHEQFGDKPHATTKTVFNYYTEPTQEDVECSAIYLQLLEGWQQLEYGEGKLATQHFILAAQLVLEALEQKMCSLSIVLFKFILGNRWKSEKFSQYYRESTNAFLGMMSEKLGNFSPLRMAIKALVDTRTMFKWPETKIWRCHVDALKYACPSSVPIVAYANNAWVRALVADGEFIEAGSFCEGLLQTSILEKGLEHYATRRLQSLRSYIFFKQKMYDDATSVLDRGLTRHPLTGQVLVRDFTDFQLLTNLGKVFLAKEDLQSAETCFRTALEWALNNYPSNAGEIKEKLDFLAWTLLRQGNESQFQQLPQQYGTLIQRFQATSMEEMMERPRALSMWT